MTSEYFESGQAIKFSPEITDDHHVISHLNASLWFKSLELTVVDSTSSSRRPIHDQRKMAYAEKKLESMVYSITQKRGRWPFLTPRLQSVTDKTKETAPPLIEQVLEFMQDQLEQAEKTRLMVRTFVSLANDTSIKGF